MKKYVSFLLSIVLLLFPLLNVDGAEKGKLIAPDIDTIFNLNESDVTIVNLSKYFENKERISSIRDKDKIKQFYFQFKEIPVSSKFDPQEYPRIYVEFMTENLIYMYNSSSGFTVYDWNDKRAIHMQYSLPYNKLIEISEGLRWSSHGFPNISDTTLSPPEPNSYCKFTVGDTTFQFGGDTKPIDSNPLVVPYIDEASERTMIPLRALAEALGYEVGWEEAEERVTLGNGLLEAELKIGSPEATVRMDKQYQGNWEKTINLDAFPVTVNDRTFVPVRFLSEALGYSVVWDSIRNKVYIDPIADQEVLDNYPYLEFSDDGTAEVGMRTYNNGQIPRIWHFPDGTPLQAEIYSYDGQKILSLPDSNHAIPYKIFYPDSDNADSYQFSVQGLAPGLYYADVWYSNQPNEIYRVFFETE